MGLLLLYMFLALSVSFICSLMESVILSVSHSFIAVLIKEGSASGRLLNQMKRNIDHPLAAILTLNTVANTIGAAGVGAQTYKVFGSRWVALSSVVLTLLILTCSEIIPKTIGATHWKSLAPVSAYILRGMIVMLYPIVKILEGVSSLVAGKEGRHSHLTREELRVLAELGEHEGILLRKEARIMENLLLLSEMRAEDVLTPRSVLVAFQEDRNIGEVYEEESPLRFSRIPIYGKDLDDIVGVVYKTELVEAYYTGKQDMPVKTIGRSLHAVPGAKAIADVLDEFIMRREHMFLVIDEYGGTAGIVTLEDVIETLLGVEIVDELDSVTDMRAFAIAKWKRRRKGKDI